MATEPAFSPIEDSEDEFIGEILALDRHNPAVIAVLKGKEGTPDRYFSNHPDYGWSEISGWRLTILDDTNFFPEPMTSKEWWARDADR